MDRHRLGKRYVQEIGKVGINRTSGVMCRRSRMCVSKGTAIGITISSVSVVGIRETQHVGVISLGRSRSIRVRMELMTGMKAMRGRSRS